MALIPTAVLLALASVIFLSVASRDDHPATSKDDHADAYTFKHAAGQLAANGIALVPFGVVLEVRRQRLDTVGISRHNLAPALLIAVVASVAAAVIKTAS